jgi:2-amino-4-hydroxy-6-hydroxymethyldihydropteridine diphosphokinase
MKTEEKVGTPRKEIIDSSTPVYLGLGSNLGDRERNLRDAIAGIGSTQLESAALAITRSSAIYESEPVGYGDQPWFLNQVVEVRIKSALPNNANSIARAHPGPLLRAPELLEALLEIEHRMGRVRTIRDGPRLIDIDILLCGDLVGAWPCAGSTGTTDPAFLTLPHPRMHLRRFVIEPLCELAPALVHPTLGKPMRELLGALDESPAVHRFVGAR